MEQPPGNKLVLDPNADTVIILRHANAEFAVWDEEAEFPRPPFVLPEEDDEESMSEDQETSVNVQTAYTGNPTWLEGHEAGIPALSEQMEAQARVSVEVTNEESGSDASESSEGREEYLFYVSSRHLALASTYFHNNLSNKWDQHPRDHEGRLMITERRWSVEGFMRLMCIMHGRTRAVARELELEQLAEMAAMVDYYSCDEVVEPYSQGWIDHQRKKIKPFERTYNRDLVLWMCIAWVFGQKEEFERTTLVAIKHCSSEMQSLELPIPELIIESIEHRRQAIIDRLITSLSQLLDDLLNGTKGCSIECASTFFGFFSKAMHVRGLRSPTLRPPYLGVGVTRVLEQLRLIGYPKFALKNMFHERFDEHRCALVTVIPKLVKKVDGDIKGLELSAFPSRRHLESGTVDSVFATFSQSLG